MHATAPIDRQAAKIAEWMRVLLRPGQVVEVRAIEPFASRVFDTARDGEIEALGRFAAQCSQRAKGVYFTPNPLNPPPLSGSQGSALDADVAARAWLLVDCDPRHAKKQNATAGERVATLAAIQGVSDTLAALGFAGIVVGDSGNGYHLMVPVELPNDQESYRMHADFLRHLEERFGSDLAEFDQKVKNAARIWKVPATVARKGPQSAERPHRHARLIHFPEDPHRFARSNVEALKKLLALWQFRAVDPPKAGGDDRAKLVERAAKYVCRKDVAVQGQNGSDRCYHVACTLVCRFGLTQDEAFEAIQNWNGQCQPPWSERELRHKIADAAKQPVIGDLASGRAVPGPQPSANGGHKGKDSQSDEPEAWEEPKPLTRVPCPAPFPTHVLPRTIADYVREVAWAINVPEDFAGVCVLAVASAAVGYTRRLLVKRGYHPSACLYAAFVARPGAAKSAVLRCVSRPLAKAEEQYRKDHRRDIEVAREAAGGGTPRPVPAARRCFTTTSTVEGTARLLAKQPRGLAIIADELSGLIAGMNQYKSGGKGNDRQFFLSAWDHSPFAADRADETRSLYLAHPYLAICGAIQPDVVESLRGQRGMAPAPDDGFLDRFLMAYPNQVPDVSEDWREISEGAEASWERAVGELLALNMMPNGKPTLVPLNADGRKAYQSFTARNAAETNDEDFPDILRGPWAKLRGYCLRLALLLHLLDQAADGLCDTEVDGSSIERAEHLVSYFKSHCRRITATIARDPIFTEAEYVWGWILRRELATVSFREMYRSIGSTTRFPDVESLQRPVRLLVEYGYLRPADLPPGGKAGRPHSPTYEVNPLSPPTPTADDVTYPQNSACYPQNPDADDP